MRALLERLGATLVGLGLELGYFGDEASRGGDCARESSQAIIDACSREQGRRDGGTPTCTSGIGAGGPGHCCYSSSP